MTIGESNCPACGGSFPIDTGEMSADQTYGIGCPHCDHEFDVILDPSNPGEVLRVLAPNPIAALGPGPISAILGLLSLVSYGILFIIDNSSPLEGSMVGEACCGFSMFMALIAIIAGAIGLFRDR